MKLKKIIENIQGVRKVEGKLTLDVKGLACDSKKVKESYLFVAIKGSRFNGADFIDEAIERGASSIILDWNQGKGPILRKGPAYIYVDDARAALSQGSRLFYKDLSANMYIIGITGTNGKTTATYLIESLFKKKGEETGVIGTINYRFGKRLIPSLNTTPGVLDLYTYLSNMHKEGVKNCIIEASSHSLDQGRIDTLQFDAAIFTNLTKEHLDYHRDMDSYLASKMKLFTKIKNGGYAIINRDDPYSGRIIDRVRSDKKANIITYGIENSRDVYASDIKSSQGGLRFTICTQKGPAKAEIESRLIGRHNVYNILASAACGIAMGMTLEEISSGLGEVAVLPGRLEKIDCGQDFQVFVDYAHTEDGMENVLKALRELNPERILCVFGCGGDRDKSKRGPMGRITAEISDKLFITSDNPRSEDPAEIIREIARGIDRKDADYVIELDRYSAIDKALKEARKGDIVLVAGKGHETYQIFKDTTLPFDDREVVKKILSEAMGYGNRKLP
ncbi:MAG: UDP-N-acetylmuramoyl-L-alanyl-D-glutamate--2,6-diaminopimelate ligase [Candidatus Omnitrophica bacterium]|nr:UDP-N-acetylmuramoyl-L-alanyl-D-glutamate--2,6-diaminopimelate ligase [Candidatus Omnitrophota bacterium]MBU4458096.1 UDP-N-acetylmuramoyl-L-alanyl-D-glutamate--2,6-diaminopimelate ligase [Candidatus Omnitrophota bacterium]